MQISRLTYLYCLGDVRPDAMLDRKTNLWSAWINFYKDETLHICPLIESAPTYNSAEEAVEASEKMIEEIRGLEVV